MSSEAPAAALKTRLIEKGNAPADGRLPMVVIDQVLAIAGEDLQVALERASERKRPVDLRRTARAIAAAQRMTAGEGEHLARVPVHGDQLASPHEVLDVRIVVVG